jgi:uncharacterized protein with ATP-grasp and redox domains
MIDLGAQAEFGSVYSIIEDSLGYQLDQEQYRNFKESVGQSSLILYLADNSYQLLPMEINKEIWKKNRKN